MSMFDEYNNIPSGYVPCNRIKFVDEPMSDNLIIGGTCTFTFSFNIKQSDITSVKFIFKEGLSVFTTKTGSDVTITTKGNDILVSTTLKPVDTSKAVVGRDMIVQVKFELVNGNTVYSNKVKLNVIPTLDN